MHLKKTGDQFRFFLGVVLGLGLVAGQAVEPEALSGAFPAPFFANEFPVALSEGPVVLPLEEEDGVR